MLDYNDCTDALRIRIAGAYHEVGDYESALSVLLRVWDNQESRDVNLARSISWLYLYTLQGAMNQVFLSKATADVDSPFIFDFLALCQIAAGDFGSAWSTLAQWYKRYGTEHALEQRISLLQHLDPEGFQHIRSDFPAWDGLPAAPPSRSYLTAVEFRAKFSEGHISIYLPGTIADEPKWAVVDPVVLFLIRDMGIARVLGSMFERLYVPQQLLDDIVTGTIADDVADLREFVTWFREWEGTLFERATFRDTTIQAFVSSFELALRMGIPLLTTDTATAREAVHRGVMCLPLGGVLEWGSSHGIYHVDELERAIAGLVQKGIISTLDLPVVFGGVGFWRALHRTREDKRDAARRYIRELLTKTDLLVAIKYAATAASERLSREEEDASALVVALIAEATKSMLNESDCLGFFVALFTQAGALVIQEAVLETMLSIPRDLVPPRFRNVWLDLAYQAYGVASKVGGWDIPLIRISRTPAYYRSLLSGITAGPRRFGEFV